MRRSCLVTCVLIATTFIAACAFDIAHVEQIPTSILLSAPAKPAFILEHDVSLALPFGYHRVLRGGTKWTYLGAIAAGDVYTTKDQVLTLEASNIYEAHIVVRAGKLVGFYLPVERAYSPAVESTSLPLKEI